jgi:DNA-binding PadR family transcriptional regulator
VDDDDKLAHYIEIGAVELAGMDESGEFIFQITEKAREIAPELWEAHEEHINNSLMRLYKEGLINVTYNEDLEAVIEMSPEGHRVARELGLIEIDMPDQDIPND